MFACARIGSPWPHRAVVETSSLESPWVCFMSEGSHKKTTKRETVTQEVQAAELSPPPAFEQEERTLRELEKKILAVPSIERDLKKITTTADERAQILRLLALAVFDDKMAWRREVKQQQGMLRSVARRLRVAAADFEEVTRDPRAGPDFWLALLGMMKWDQVSWPPEKGSKSFVGALLRNAAKGTEGQASALGRVLRKGALFSQRVPILALSHCSHRFTGHYHDNEVARLMTDAHAAIGMTEDFSAAQVKKLRQRYRHRSSKEL
jgi:hypothetical protein